MVALKALVSAGVPVVCFEKGDRVGGNWVFRNTNGMSASYRSLHINTSRERMEYSDFPMPKSYPDFPHHTQIKQYLEAYVDHFDLRRHIRFSTGVQHAAQHDGGWLLTLEDGSTEQFDALVVANGHHWDPALPDPPFPGVFDGRQLHSHDYVEPEPFRGLRVVVVGRGNSAMDIAVELGEVADRVFLSARRFTVPHDKRATGVAVVTYPDIPWSRCDIKTVNLLADVMAKQ
jgi:cation diffusion facilitator CzcD-associated flavoprotein CzcO